MKRHGTAQAHGARGREGGRGWRACGAAPTQPAHLHRAQGDHLSGLSGSGEVAEIIERWVQDMILGVLETPPKM